MNIYSCDRTDIKYFINFNFFEMSPKGRKTWSQRGGKETKLRDEIRKMCEKVGWPRDENK